MRKYGLALLMISMILLVTGCSKDKNNIQVDDKNVVLDSQEEIEDKENEDDNIKEDNNKEDDDTIKENNDREEDNNQGEVDTIKDDKNQEDDLINEEVDLENIDISIWEMVSGTFVRDDSSQYSNGILNLKYLSNSCAMFEFRLMEGNESEDTANELIIPFVLIVGDDGIGRHETENNTLSINFELSEDGKKVIVSHSGMISISPDGVYTYVSDELEVSDASATAIIESLPTALTSLNSNNGEYTLNYPEALVGDWFYTIEAVYNDTKVVLAKFIVAKDLSAVYRVDDDMEPILIFGSAQPMLDAMIFNDIIMDSEADDSLVDEVAYEFPIVSVVVEDGIILEVGKSSKLMAQMPWELPYTITANSSDPSIATIDENNIITGLAEGEVTITGVLYIDDGAKEFSINLSVGSIQ